MSTSEIQPGRAPQVLKFQGAMMTRREIEIARFAFDEGARWRVTANSSSRTMSSSREAEERYPHPKVTRMRDVAIRLANGNRFLACSVNGQLMDSDQRKPLERINVEEFGPEGLRQVADLLANPTEEVDAE